MKASILTPHAVGSPGRKLHSLNVGLFLAAIASGSGLVVLMNIDDPRLVLVGLLALGIAGVAVYPSWRAVFSAVPLDLFEARHVFLLYFFLQFGLNTVVLLSTGEGYLTGDVRRASDTIVTALCYALLGLCAFQLGYAVSRSSHRGPAGGRPWPQNNFALRAAVVGAYLVAIGSFLYLMELEGGLLYYFTHIEEIRETRLLGRGMFYYLTATASVAWLVSSGLAARARGRLPSFQLILGLLLMAAYLGMGFRLMAVYTLLQGLLLHHYLVRPIRLRLRYLPLLVVGVVLMNFYQIYRGISPRKFADIPAELHEQLGKPQVRSQLLTGVFHRFQGTDSMVRILQVSETVGFDLGRSLARDLLLTPIPRYFWPHKPEPKASELWNEVYFYGSVPEGTYGARVPTLVGELYVYGHLPGVLLGMFLMGVFARFAYNHLRDDPGRSAVMPYAVVFCFLFSVNETLQTHLVLLLVRIMTLAAILMVSRLASLPRKARP